MDVIPGAVIVEPAENRQATKSQPIEALGKLDPLLDEAQVRQAIVNAEANNQDPQSLTMSDFAQAPASNPQPVEVPQKFLKPDGTADVEKIQASTKALDEGIEKKEVAVAKTVDDYMREYNEKQAKFRSLPNAERLTAQAPPVQSPPAQEVPPQNYEEIVRRDYQTDPLATTARLIDLIVQKRFEPLEVRERTEATRSNIQALAAKDSRVLREDVFSAINAKLNSDQDFWKLKNPHKAAWLEVKEEMRLGEAPNGAPAQPSRLSPVLGGGTPPSVPSAPAQSPQNVIANLNSLDLRDKKQEAMGDEAIRALLAQSRG